MTRKSVTFRLPVELLKAVDEARGDVSRTRFVERALEQALERTKTALWQPESAPSRPPAPTYRKPFNPRPKGS